MTDLVIQKKEYLTKMALASLKRTANEYINLSQICHEYHQDFGYQDYEQWIKNDLGLGITRGKQLLTVYDQFGITPQCGVDNFQVAALFLLAAPSTPETARAEAIERAEAGETLTIKQTKSLIEAKKRIESLQQELDAAKKDLGSANVTLMYREDLSARVEELEARLEAEKNKPAIVEFMTVEKIPDDYPTLVSERNSLVDERDLLLSQIKKLKNSMRNDVNIAVDHKLSELDREIKDKSDHVEAIQRSIEALRPQLNLMESKAGNLTACKEMSKQVRHHLYEISILLGDYFSEYELPGSELSNLEYLANEMSKGAESFRIFLKGGSNELTA